MKVGIAGIGFMGMVHYLSYKKIDGIEVTALAEPNEKRLGGDWTDIQGNFGPPGEMMDLEGIEKYSDVSDMLAQSDIDYVDICLPPSMHAPIALDAFGHEKHVFSEKPIALKLEEAKQMTAAAKEADRLLMIGHVLPFFPEFRKAYEIIQSGTYGKLLGGNFLRVISDPTWLNNYWDAERVGGPMLDLHVHDAHFIRLLFGMPQGVTSVGRVRNNLAEYWNTQFDFADTDLVVTATSGVINQQGRPFKHGFEIHLEEATLAFEFATVDGNGELTIPFTVFEKEGKTLRPDVGDGDPLLAFEAELATVVESMSSSKASPILEGSLAQDAVALCHRQTESVLTRKRVAC